MPKHHTHLCHLFGTGRAHIIRPQNLDYRSTRQPHVLRQKDDRKRQGRQCRQQKCRSNRGSGSQKMTTRDFRTKPLFDSCTSLGARRNSSQAFFQFISVFYEVTHAVGSCSVRAEWSMKCARYLGHPRDNTHSCVACEYALPAPAGSQGT